MEYKLHSCHWIERGEKMLNVTLFHTRAGKVLGAIFKGIEVSVATTVASNLLMCKDITQRYQYNHSCMHEVRFSIFVGI